MNEWKWIDLIRYTKSEPPIFILFQSAKKKRKKTSPSGPNKIPSGGCRISVVAQRISFPLCKYIYIYPYLFTPMVHIISFIIFPLFGLVKKLKNKKKGGMDFTCVCVCVCVWESVWERPQFVNCYYSSPHSCFGQFLDPPPPTMRLIFVSV